MYEDFYNIMSLRFTSVKFNISHAYRCIVMSLIHIILTYFVSMKSVKYLELTVIYNLEL